MLNSRGTDPPRPTQPGPPPRSTKHILGSDHTIWCVCVRVSCVTMCASVLMCAAGLRWRIANVRSKNVKKTDELRIWRR